MQSPGHSEHCRCGECCHDKDRHRLIRLENINFGREGRSVLTDINFTVDSGDFVAITGPNGGGKTTILRIILGLLRPETGSVIFYGADGAPVPSLRFGYLPQKNSVDSRFPITVGEVVASGLLAEKGMDSATKRRLIGESLAAVELADLAGRPIGKLSGGQLQRALLARAIVRRPSVLILDEPLSYIDKHFEEKLYPLIADIARRSTVLLVSHEMSHIAGMANRHIIVDHTLTECSARHHYMEPECTD